MEYLPKDLDDMLYDVIDKSNEVIENTARILHFGPDQKHPDSQHSPSNVVRLITKTRDLQEAVNRYAASQNTKSLISKEDWIGDL